MKLVLQRVNNASVTVDNEITGQINKGILILVGISKDYNEKKLDWMINKILTLRLWHTSEKGFQKNIEEIQGDFLIVSQFTLHSDCTSGTKPNFSNSMESKKAEEIYNLFIEKLKNKTKRKVETGKFGAMMDVKLENSGPITLVLEK